MATNNYAHVDDLDVLLFGIEGVGSEGLVQYDPDNGQAFPLTSDTFFYGSDLHMTTFPVPTLPPNTSQSLPPLITSDTSLWDDFSVVSPCSRSYAGSPQDYAFSQTGDLAAWDNAPNQTGSSGPWTEHNFSFSSDGACSPITADLPCMLAEESNVNLFPNGFLSPNSFPAGWMNSTAYSMSRTTSEQSFQTAIEETNDAMPSISRTSNKVSSPTLEPMKTAGELPKPDFVYLKMDFKVNRMTPEIGPDKKKTKGRNGPLKPEVKQGAAKMRKVKACDNCQRRKTRCDDGVACKACIQYYRCTLINTPCRNGQLQDLASILLTGKVFPSARPVEDYMFGKRLKNNPAPLSIEINLGFGVSMTRNVTTVWPADYIFVSPPPEFSHEHVVYPWPVEEGQTTQKEVRQHWVFPAVLTDIHTLMSDVDQHLSTLLDERENFYQFPFFNSPLKVLMMIYAYYEGLSESSEKVLLRNALKLLILIHIGGDTTISPTAQSHDIVNQFFGPCISLSSVTPCFIRGQLGPVFSDLALKLMKNVLNDLEYHCLSMNCGHFPLVVATFAVVFMAVESIRYHSAKEAFHSSYDYSFLPHGHGHDHGTATSSEALDEAEQALLKFYKACFSGCHRDALFSVSRSGTPPKATAAESTAGGMSFVAGLKDAVGKVKFYLAEKSKVSVSVKGATDMTVFFDRLLAKLFLLEG